MREVLIYTDGACRGNPGPGGYGCILRYGQHFREISGGFAHTTNNRMEIYAVIIALEVLKYPCRAQVYSDSRYVVDAVSKNWLERWACNGWRKADKQPVLNMDLWQRLLKQLQTHECCFNWVKGHAENPDNNRCDELATLAATMENLSTDPGFTEKEVVEDTLFNCI